MSTNEINDISENAQTNSLEDSALCRTWNLLNFTPVTYRIEIYGDGANIAVEKITEEAYEYWCDFSSCDLSSFAEYKCFDVPNYADFFQGGFWHELNEALYLYDPIICQCEVMVYDENDQEHFKCSLDNNGLAKSGINTFMGKNLNDQLLEKQPYYMGKLNEGGLYFTGYIQLDRPFDARRLTLSYDEFEGEKFLTNVFYDNNIVDDVGYREIDSDEYVKCKVFKL